jgi:hypothetical protein
MTALRRSVKVPRDAWTLTFVAIATLCIALTDAETFYVTAPLAVGLLTALVFLWSLSCRRHGAVPWFELGAVYLAAATLYFVYPLLGFLAIDGIYIRTNDLRLASLPPTPAEAGAIGWLYACHVVAFAAAYLVTRGRLPTAQSVPRPPGASIFMAVVVAYGLIEVFNVFLGLFFDMSSTTYAGSYLAARRLPLVLSQLLNHLSGVKYALSLMLLAALFTRYRRFKPVIITWLDHDRTPRQPERSGASRHGGGDDVPHVDPADLSGPDPQHRRSWTDGVCRLRRASRRSRDRQPGAQFQSVRVRQ